MQSKQNAHSLLSIVLWNQFALEIYARMYLPTGPGAPGGPLSPGSPFYLK